MVKLGVDKGIRKYIKFKTDPGNLVFSEAVDNVAPLFTRMVRLHSNYAYGTNAAGAVGIHVLHRRRTADAPGCCFRFDGLYLPNLIATRNVNFEMQEPFTPQRGEDLPQLRDVLNRTALVEGLRTTAVNGRIRRNFLKK